MIILNATNQILELQSSAPGSLDYEVAYLDHNPAAPALNGAPSRGNITTAGTTTIVAAPASGVERQIKALFIRNKSLTVANKVTIKIDNGTTEFLVSADVTLAAGEVLQFVDGIGWQVLDANGNLKSSSDSGFTGRPLTFFKVGTAKEAAGVWYSFSKDTGNPGAWAPGTPGLSGRATDGLSAGDAGSLNFPDPASGSMFLTDISLFSGIAEMLALFDILWVNSGIVVTTTTAQTINSVAFPARDIEGAINGKGCEVGIFVSVATTNAAAITNMTMSYTNSDGVSGRTATMASFPATAVIGTVVWFQLQAGDVGVQSIQSITLGTSLVTGTVHLIVARKVADISVSIASVPVQRPFGRPGIRLYNRSTLIPFVLPSAVTATNISGSVVLQER